MINEWIDNSGLLREIREVPSTPQAFQDGVLEHKHWTLPHASPPCRGWNSGLAAFGLTCNDISDLLKNTIPEKVMLEHPKEQVSCL